MSNSFILRSITEGFMVFDFFFPSVSIVLVILGFDALVFGYPIYVGLI